MNQHINNEVLAAYAHNLLSDVEQGKVSAHLAQCSACQAKLTIIENEITQWQRLLFVELQQKRPSSQATFSALNLRHKRSIQMYKVADFLAPIAIVLLILIGTYTFWPASTNPAATATTTEPTVESIENPLELAVQNLSYVPFGNSESITLVDGKSSNVALESYEIGDLNGDGLDDVAFIVTNTIDNSRLPEVGVALNMGDDMLSHVGNEFLFPDAKVMISIVGLQVVVEVETVANTTQSLTYIVANGRLVQPEMMVAETREDAQYQEYLDTEWNLGQATPTNSILTRETLSNMAYQVEHTQSGNASLKVGTYRESPRTVVRLLPAHAYGDMTGDGVAEAVVTLGTSTGGSGTFVDIVVVVAIEGQPHQLTSFFLGDRVQVNSITIENRLIQIDYDDTTQVFELIDETLHSLEDS
ncbi:MAG: zf-HC2 domain-containing protein [Chloroflexota bacterium]